MSSSHLPIHILREIMHTNARIIDCNKNLRRK